MRLRPAGVLLIGLLLGCGGQQDATQNASMPQAKLDTLRADQAEVLFRLRTGGMEPRTREATRVANSMIRAMKGLPEKPSSHCYLDVEEERMVMVEFPSVATAKQMEAAYEDGFRFRNWYFGGMVTVETTRRMQSALGS